MIKFQYRTKKEAFDVYYYIKQNIKKDTISEYYINDYYEKESNLIYFTLGHDEEERKYEIFYTYDTIYITPEDKYFNYKDIAFIMYPISELILEF